MQLGFGFQFSLKERKICLETIEEQDGVIIEAPRFPTIIWMDQIEVHQIFYSGPWK